MTQVQFPARDIRLEQLRLLAVTARAWGLHGPIPARNARAQGLTAGKAPEHLRIDYQKLVVSLARHREQDMLEQRFARVSQRCTA